MILKTRTQRGTVSIATLALSSIALGALAVPVACLAVTRQEPSPKQPAPAAHSIQSSPQIEVTAKIAAGGFSFASLGLTPENVHPGKAGGNVWKADGNFILDLTDEALQALTEKTTEKRCIVSAPTVRTISLQKATITTASGNNVQEKVEVTPRLNSDGTLTISLNVQLEDGPRHNTQSVLYRCKSGSTMVLGRPKTEGRPVELVAIVKARVLKEINP